MQRPTDPTGSGAPRAPVPDVRVGEWSMLWTARDGVGRLGPGIPKSDFWASAKERIDQVGCVVGPDLVYRPMGGGWVGQRDQSHDRVVRRGVTGAEFTRYVKSTYRILLTCGLRGCYVYFMNGPTRDCVIRRMERPQRQPVIAAEKPGPYPS